MLKINGVAITTPSEFLVDIADMDSEQSQRVASGKLVRDRIAVKRKLSCEWSPLTMNEISAVLKSVKATSFSVEYPDPEEGNFITKIFYVGDRSAPAYWKDPKTGQYLWKGLKMNFTEI